MLICILALAAFVRFYHPTQSPPGLNVDECSEVWNAQCLLKTGMDEHGVRWPIFASAQYAQAIDTVTLYLQLPFQFFFGMNAATGRAPSALCGVLTVFLIYYVGRRMFCRWTGLAAAALLAVNPWHLLQSRWAHEASVVPFLAIAPLAAMLWANLPFGDKEIRPLNPIRAGLAGAVTGICTYGYLGVRLWIPVFYMAAVLVTWRAWWERLRTRQGAIAIGAFLLMAMLFFGPLLWATHSNPLLTKRAGLTWVWNPTDSIETKIGKVLSRYPGHFGLSFLFLQGDPDISFCPPQGYGYFCWYTLPLMILGLAHCFARLKSSRTSRVLLTWVILYPAADLLSEHPAMHALRSLPGICGLVLLSAVGLVFTMRWLWQRKRATAIVLAVGASAIVLVSTIRFLDTFFGQFNSDLRKYLVGHVDLLEACQWLKPRLKEEDAVFVTGTGMGHPYTTTLVGLQYDPRQWFLDVKQTMEGPLPNGAYRNEEIVLRYGKMHFMFDASARSDIEQLERNGHPDRVVFIVRPWEVPLGGRFSPVQQILDPEGNPSLVIYEFTI
ncbi:MAG: hypothetical protein PHX83_09210 [Acidobacteriia bacterium]|nr:hypothetical protein [Terriglobia bacterium]